MNSCALIGPGAVGLYYGGLLAKAGVPLHILARSDFAALRKNGITLRIVNLYSRKLNAVCVVKPERIEQDARLIGPADWVIITAKATANQSLLPILQTLVKSEKTVLLTLQNGMGNTEFLARHFPKNPILAGLCFVCVNRTAAGIVENYLPGRVEIGSFKDRHPELSAHAVATFSAAGIRCNPAQELNLAIWRKLCWNIPFNGLSIAAGGITTDQILANKDHASRALLLMKEVQKAANLEGNRIADDFLQKQFDVTSKMGAYRPSSLIDYQEGREVEVEAIFGEPLRRAQALGLAMTELERLYHEVKRRLVSAVQP